MCVARVRVDDIDLIQCAKLFDFKPSYKIHTSFQWRVYKVDTSLLTPSLKLRPAPSHHKEPYFLKRIHFLYEIRQLLLATSPRQL